MRLPVRLIDPLLLLYSYLHYVSNACFRADCFLFIIFFYFHHPLLIISADDLTVGDRVYMSFAELRQAVRENQFIEVKWSSTVAFGILALMDRGYTGNGPMPPPLPLQSITLASTTTSAAPSSSLSSSFSAPDVRDAGADAGIGASLGVISEGGPVKITQRGPALT